MKIFSLLLILSIPLNTFAVACPPINDKMAAIDMILTKAYDADGDGIPDKIDLH